MFLPQFFSITTTCVLKCRLKFNPQPGTHLRRTCGSAYRVESKDEVCISLPDLYPNRWECERVSVTRRQVRKSWFKEAWVFGSLWCLTIGFFLACCSMSFITFFSCYAFAWEQNTQCWICVSCEEMLSLICHIYIKHICYSQDLPEIIKELSSISLKALCWKDIFAVNTMTK